MDFFGEAIFQKLLKYVDFVVNIVISVYLPVWSDILKKLITIIRHDNDVGSPD